MRSLQIRIWLLPMLAVALVWARSGASAQDNASSSATISDQPQVAQPSNGGVNWKGVGAGAGAVITNIVYVPAKLVYGILGGIGGGAGYALTGGNKQVANSIWRSSLGGDYVLTPDMMTGKQPIHFSGPSDSGSTPAIAGTGAIPPPPAPLAPSMSSTSPVTGSNSLPTAHPIDNGAGLVGTTASPSSVPYGGASNPESSYGAYSQPTPPKRSHSSDTSVE